MHTTAKKRDCETREIHEKFCPDPDPDPEFLKDHSPPLPVDSWVTYNSSIFQKKMFKEFMCSGSG